VRHGERFSSRERPSRRDLPIARCAFTNIPRPRYDLRANEVPVRGAILSDSDPVLTCVGHYVQHTIRRPRDTPISENHAVTKLILRITPEEQYLCNQSMIRIVVLYKRIRPSGSDSFLHHQQPPYCWLTPQKTAVGRTKACSADSSGHALPEEASCRAGEMGCAAIAGPSLAKRMAMAGTHGRCANRAQELASAEWLSGFWSPAPAMFRRTRTRAAVVSPTAARWIVSR
jgi:hypothetical protein